MLLLASQQVQLPGKCVGLHLLEVAQSTHHCLNLLCQLSGGRQDKCLGLQEVVVHVLEDASAEGGGLAGSRLSLLNDVQALSKGDNALLLDG